MSSKEALDLCPQAIFISGNYEKYREVGEQVREIFKRYTDLIEPMSIDEAHLDVTENKNPEQISCQNRSLDSACYLGKSCISQLQRVFLIINFWPRWRVTTKTPWPNGGLTGGRRRFLSQMDIAKFHGVGKKTVERLHKMGVYTGADL